jgi:glycine/D-amino acid oxidase-like deaminating enzyme
MIKTLNLERVIQVARTRIAGTATACYLAQYGRQVILLEQGELAAEASGLNARTLWATGWGQVPDLASTLSMGSLEIFTTL